MAIDKDAGIEVHFMSCCSQIISRTRSSGKVCSILVPALEDDEPFPYHDGIRGINIATALPRKIPIDRTVC